MPLPRRPAATARPLPDLDPQDRQPHHHQDPHHRRRRTATHKDALFSHLTERWRDLFNADFDLLLYDLTSTYFEGDAADLPEGDKRRFGYRRDKRPDCVQVVIALVVTPEGLPLAYEVLPGNTADNKTLRRS